MIVEEVKKNRIALNRLRRLVDDTELDEDESEDYFEDDDYEVETE